MVRNKDLETSIYAQILGVDSPSYVRVYSS